MPDRRRRTRSLARPGPPEPTEEPTSIGSGQTNVGAGYTADELELLKAVDAFKRKTGRQYPSCVDVMRVLVGLGYRRVENNGGTT